MLFRSLLTYVYLFSGEYSLTVLGVCEHVIQMPMRWIQILVAGYLPTSFNPQSNPQPHPVSKLLPHQPQSTKHSSDKPTRGRLKMTDTSVEGENSFHAAVDKHENALDNSCLMRTKEGIVANRRTTAHPISFSWLAPTPSPGRSALLSHRRLVGKILSNSLLEEQQWLIISTGHRVSPSHCRTMNN